MTAATHTPGPVVSNGHTIRTADKNNITCRRVATAHGPFGDAEKAANAHLIAEAFNVAHETGLTPRQLAERCKELEAAAIKVRSWLAVECRDGPLKVIDDALRSLGITDVPCPDCGATGRVALTAKESA